VDEVLELTVGETVADFLADCQARNLSPKTLLWYEQRLSILRPYWDAKPDTVDDACLEKVLRHRRPTIAPSTFNGYIRGLRAWLYWCLDEGISVPARPRRLRSLKVARVLPHNLTASRSYSCFPLLTVCPS
jgi:site-specific recombinase XerD